MRLLRVKLNKTKYKQLAKKIKFCSKRAIGFIWLQGQAFVNL